MKKFFAFIVSIVLIFSCFACLNISAERSAPFKLNITSADGNEIILSTYNNYTAKLKFTLKATDSTFAESFIINSIINTDTGKPVDIDAFSYDASLRLASYDFGERNVKFSESSLGGTVLFKIDWSDASGTSHTDTAELKIGTPAPNVSINVTSNTLTSVPGGVVELTYEVLNTGNVPVQFVTVQDENISSLAGTSYIYQADRSASALNVGQSIKEKVTFIADATIISKPTVSYAFNGKSYERKGEQLTITVNEVLPTVYLSCQNYTVEKKGSVQTFNYSINNTSSVQLKDIRVYNSDSDNADCVYGPFTLDIGQSYSGSYDIPINKSGFYKFKVSYSYDGADGTKEISAKTEYSIKFPNEVFLKIKEITPNSITEEGDVTFTLAVENGTTDDLRDLIISEDNKLMEPITLGVVLPGASGNKNSELSQNATVHIPASGTKLKFVLSYKINDELYTTSIPYEVRFDTALSTPEPSAEASPSPIEKGGSGLLLWLIIGLLFLLLIAGAIFFLIYLKKHRSPDDAPAVRRKVNNVFDDDAYDDGCDDGYIEEDDVMRYADTFSPDEEFADEISDSPEFIDENSFDIDDEGVKIYRKK